jgi:serine/threonine protein kinase
MLGDAHHYLTQLVQMLESFRTRNRFRQFLTSSLLSKRREEVKVLLLEALARLQVGVTASAVVEQRAFFDEGRKFFADQKEMLASGKALSWEKSFSDSSQMESLKLAVGEALRENSWERAENLRENRKSKLFESMDIDASQLTFGDKIGAGGFASVYLCDYLGRNVAAKVFHVQQSEEGGSQDVERVRKSFLTELDTMKGLRHENIVRVIGAVTSLEGRLVIVQEFAVQGTLHAYLKALDREITSEQRQAWMLGISRAVAYLHGKGVEHRDLKSLNVLLDDGLRPKVADFGLSKTTDCITSLSTGTASWGGSSAWTAPEVLERCSRSKASDIYSLGSILWEILTRKVPWSDEGFTGPAILFAVVNRHERPLIPNGTCTGMKELIQDCWHRTPSLRPTSKEVSRSLESGLWHGLPLWYAQ